MLLASLAFFWLLGEITPFSTRAWLDHFGVPTQAKLFGDLGVIGDGIAAVHEGRALYPADGGDLVFNYPKIWLTWGFLGLRPNTVPLWGCITGLLFICVTLAVIRPRNLLEAFYLGCILCSPVSLLLLERANSDEVIFAALALAFFRVRTSLTLAGVVFLNACAKLYPIAGILALLVGEKRRRHLVLIGTTILLFGLYIMMTLDQWRNVSTTTPRVPYWSFGSAVAGQWLGVFTNVKISHSISHLAGLSLVVAILPLIIIATQQVRVTLPVLPMATVRGLVAGTAMVGTAYLIGNSFEYRLVFLLLALPALWTFRQEGLSWDRWAGNLGLALLALCFWWNAIAGEKSLNSVLTKQALVFGLLSVMTFLSLRILQAGAQSSASVA